MSFQQIYNARFDWFISTKVYARLAAGNTLEIIINSLTSSDIPGEFIKVFGTPNKQFNSNDYLNTYDTERTKKKKEKRSKNYAARLNDLILN